MYGLLLKPEHEFEDIEDYEDKQKYLFIVKSGKREVATHQDSSFQTTVMK